MMGMDLGDIGVDFELLFERKRGLRGELAPLESTSKRDFVWAARFQQYAKGSSTDLARRWRLGSWGGMASWYAASYMSGSSCSSVLCSFAGGGSIGVAVGERITGVDPFNITTYCWVLATFMLLVAKSVRVRDWPWNDSLYGRVLRKSVSELSSVTRVDERLILAKLL